MPIGYFLAKSFQDALQFCMLLDLMLVGVGLWQLNEGDWERDLPEARTRLKVQSFAAAIGLASACIFKSRDADRYLGAAVVLAVASAAVFAFSALSEWSYAWAAQDKADEGLVELSSWFWTVEAFQFVLILILTLNHLLMAQFGRQELREYMHGHTRVSREDDKFRSEASEVL